MVVLAASICTKGGKPVISRQFRDMTRARIESLLASFPKLIPTNTQHTSIETPEVRYVYQPLEDLYILLITNKSSNILQDIETLHLIARVVSDMCRSAEEREILKNSFELLGAFDEIVSLGYREQITFLQVRSVLEMESHEEKIQEIISRNKEAEAKEELKRRAKQLEMQRREQQRRTASGIGGGGGNSYLGGGVSGYAPVSQRFDAPPARQTSPAPSSLRPPAFKSGGMKLGNKRTKQAELLDALGGEVLSTEDSSRSATPVTAAPAASLPTKDYSQSLPTVTQESVHIAVKENVSLEILREGGVKSFELRGDMNLLVSDPNYARIVLTLSPSTTNFDSDLQFRQHPQAIKFAPQAERLVALKDPAREFPVNLSLGVLRWRYVGKDETRVPLSINCWPTPSNDGSCDVNIEYELENDSLVLYDVIISIPLPTGSYPTVTSHIGEWSLNPSSHSLDWSIALINKEERSGTLEFSVGGDDTSAFFPVKITFVAQGSLSGLSVGSIALVDGGDVPFSQESVLTVDSYTVVE